MVREFWIDGERNVLNDDWKWRNHIQYFSGKHEVLWSNLPNISGPNILARDILVKTFHNRDVSTHACFGPVGVPAHGHFVSVDVMVQGLFDTGTFWHKDLSAMNVLTKGHCSTWTLRHTSTGAKISSAETSMLPKIH